MSSHEASGDTSIQSSSTEISFQLVGPSDWEQEWTVRDSASVRLQLLARRLCCRNKFRVRQIRSKGGVLVLVLNALILNYFGNLGAIMAGVLPVSKYAHSEGIIFLTVSLIQALSLVLLYPLFGWIADVYLGRYRVIHLSLWLMWSGLILLSISYCLDLLLPSGLYAAVNVIVLSVALLAMLFGVAGFNANVIPFGIDQLPTGSGDQLSGFITWYVFTVFFSIAVLPYPFSCPQEDSTRSLLLRLLFQTALLSLALVLISNLNQWFLKEPHTTNPFKLVTRVLDYARKNKQPKIRSAFTYQDDIQPSRIEYAKGRFGGPFTTEQVEDVKTFLKVVFVLLPIGATLILDIYTTQVVPLFSSHVNSNGFSCYTLQGITNLLPFIIVVCAIPAYEFLIYPVFQNYIPSMLTRIGIGIVFIILSYVAFLTIDLVGHTRDSLGTSDATQNFTCMFVAGGSNLNVNLLWLVLPATVIGLSIVFHSTAVYEFVFSQSPHNMKGLLMGVIYAIEGIFQLLGLALQAPFYLGYADSMTSVLSCSSVYILILLVLSISSFIVYVVVARSYHKRGREDSKRPQDYAEEYYSKYLRSKRHNKTVM